MVEVILDIKNNKRKLVSESSPSHDTIIKCIRTMVNDSKGTVEDALRVPLADLLNAETKGVRVDVYKCVNVLIWICWSVLCVRLEVLSICTCTLCPV